MLYTNGKTKERILLEDRSNLLVYAIRLGIIPVNDLYSYFPHIVMFGRNHVETILRSSDGKWRIFNRDNFRDLYDRIVDEIDKRNAKLPPIYQLVFPDSGMYSNLYDPIPDDLFYSGLIVEYFPFLNSSYSLSQLVDQSLPQWMKQYRNVRFLRYYKDSYEEVSIREIMKVEGIEDYNYRDYYQYYLAFDTDDIDYSVYQKEVSNGKVS